MHILELGWNASWEHAFHALQPPAHWLPGRVCRQDRLHTVVSAEGTHLATLSGRFHHHFPHALDQPVVGDWVALELDPQPERARIHAVLPRRSQFIRKSAGKSSKPQVVAANLDRVFLVSGLDEDFNLRRIERYLAVATQSGAQPVIVLNKADLCEDLEDTLLAVASIAGSCPLLALSATAGDGLEKLRPFLPPRETAALLGSSGVGKSTLLNALTGEARQIVQQSRAADGRGRHTTTARALFQLPAGALLIDTPGMRELGLHDGESDLATTFGILEALATECRFADCKHETEPGCALREAIASGDLDPAFFAHWQQLQAEQAQVASKQDKRLKRIENERWKRLSKRNAPPPKPDARETGR